MIPKQFMRTPHSPEFTVQTQSSNSRRDLDTIAGNGSDNMPTTTQEALSAALAIVSPSSSPSPSSPPLQQATRRRCTSLPAGDISEEQAGLPLFWFLPSGRIRSRRNDNDNDNINTSHHRLHLPSLTSTSSSDEDDERTSKMPRLSFRPSRNRPFCPDLTVPDLSSNSNSHTLKKNSNSFLLDDDLNVPDLTHSLSMTEDDDDNMDYSDDEEDDDDDNYESLRGLHFLVEDDE